MQLFLNRHFLASRKNSSTSSLTQLKICLLPIEGCQTYWDSLGQSLSLSALQSVTLLRLCVVFTDAYNSGVLISGWHSIHINYFFFHVKFEGSLLISVLRNRTTLYGKLEFKTDEFSKSSHFFKSHLLVLLTHIVTLWSQHTLWIYAGSHYRHVGKVSCCVQEAPRADGWWRLFEKCELFENSSVLNSNFSITVALFSRPRYITSLQISHEKRSVTYLLIAIEKWVLWVVCARKHNTKPQKNDWLECT
jgi:hypothetical protein